MPLSVTLLAQTRPHEQRAKEIYRKLIEIDTTDTADGNVTRAAEAMAERLKAAGFPAAASRLAAQAPFWNAMMRTTCVATMLGGGRAHNALPQLASANVNCRIIPGVSPASMREKLVEALADPKIKVSFVGQPTPSEPSPLRPDVMGAVESLTKEMFPGVVVAPVMTTGASDGRYLRNVGIPTYGVRGLFLDINDVRAHGKDERLGVKQYFEGLEFLYRLIKALAGGS